MAVTALLHGPTALAVQRIDLQAGQLQSPGVAAARGVTARIDLRADGRAALQAAAASVTAPALAAPLAGLQIQCRELVLREPDWRCESGSLRVRQSPLGDLQSRLQLRFDSAHAAADAQMSGIAIADGRLDVRLHGTADRWQLEASGWQGTLPALATWLQRWWTAPAGWLWSGRIALQAQAQGRGAHVDSSTLYSQWRELSLQNAAGTVVTDKVALDLDATLHGAVADWQAEVALHGTGGQALAGPALLDFAAHPLQVRTQVHGAGTAPLALRELRVDSDGLVAAHGEAQLALQPAPTVRSATVTIDSLRFPAAYASFLQLPLATTDFGNLQSQGDISGQLQLRDDLPTSLDLVTRGLDFSDDSKALALRGLQGEIHWRAAGQSAPPESRLQWQSARAFGLSGGATALQLLAQGRDLRLTAPARLPLFDGALQVQRFDARRLGASDVELDFDGRLDAIGMPQLSRAFGWPEMAGTLSGRLPGLSFRAGTLSVAGDLSARVFDGTITASGLQLRDAFGRFPRLRGTFTARRLDLAAITRTFPIGSISGRLDADVQGLELFAWSPVAFDAQLYTSPGDRSRHRISQKAVNSLANLGGGGGGVMAALQSGFLRFFDEFGYDRIGLRCQLRDDVCLMNGIARPEGGFYIVKGGGLPRLDVIGTSGRVAWSQLLTQVQAALAGGELQVR